MSKESDEVLYKPHSYVIDKDESGKYNFPDSLKLKTKGYQWFVQNSSAASGKILKVKNPETKYTVMNDFNLGPLDGLWAVSSSSTEGSRLQDKAKERFLQRGVPDCPTFGSFVKTRTSCWILEEKDGEFFCDCFEGIKGRLCKHSIGMMYFVGKLTAEEDVRSVPLGSKRKRGRPAKNRHCLTRSPTLHHAPPLQCDDEISAQPCEAQTVDDQLDAQATAMDPSGAVESNSDAMDPSGAVESNELFLHLDSESDEDVDILGAKYTYKPPKKKAKVSEVLDPSVPSSSRGRQRGRGVCTPKRRGRGRAVDSSRNDRSASPSGSLRHTSPPPTASSITRGRRGRPRGSRGARLGRQGHGSQRASLGCTTPPTPPQPPSESTRGRSTPPQSSRGSTRGRPRGSRGSRQARRI